MVGYEMLELRAPELDPSSDSFFDGELIGNKSTASHWIEENTVHRAPSISSEVYSTRFFLGPQVLIVRDEVRRLSHALAPEFRQLGVVTLKDGSVVGKQIVFSGYTQRAHITLRKYDGKIFVLHSSGSGETLSVYLDDRRIETEASAPDFPFMAFAQEPVGFVATTPPPYGILAYKSRDTGKIYLRRIVGDEIGQERLLNSPPSIGGVDFGISGQTVIFRINVLSDGKVVPMSAVSNDGGETITDFTKIDLGDAPFTEFRPANTATEIDRSGNIHIPIGAVQNDDFHLIDCVPGKVATDAIVTKKNTHNFEAFGPFPSTGGKTVFEGISVGDGITDGDGIIISVVSDGRIFASNSQSGGTSYPQPAQLNYDMPKAACLKGTQCFTKGVRSNTVSMDYLLLEADDLVLVQRK
jgi:hypothetical protein